MDGTTPCDGCHRDDGAPAVQGSDDERGPQLRLGAAEPPKSGILNVDKPLGPTSHDVVAAIRKASSCQRVGHAGTLDPMATGVLVVCLGPATRVIDEIQDTPKRYRAIVRFGRATTTYDAEGETTFEHDWARLSKLDVETALEAFRGPILQTPPMYSALRKDGKRLYELARQGVEVEREARPVTVHRLQMLAWEPPDATLELEVSKGTYIRSIAHDLGQALGVGAYLAGLTRTAVGRFELTDSQPLETIVEAFAEGWWPTILQPLDAALLHYGALIVDADGEADLRNGRQISGPPPGSDGSSGRLRGYSADGLFVALLRWDHSTENWQPHKVFPRPS